MKLLWLCLLFCAPVYAQTMTTRPLPVCLPKIQWPLAEHHETIPAGVSTRYTMSSTYVCTTPAGFVTMVNLFAPTADVIQAAWDYANGNKTLAQAQADCAVTCVPNTDSEQSYSNALVLKYTPIAVVAFNGAATSRGVYTTKADGTLNPTPLAGEQIAVGTRCAEGLRIPQTTTSTTGYYSVSGLKDTHGNALPAGSYAVCIVSFPLPPN